MNELSNYKKSLEDTIESTHLLIEQFIVTRQRTEDICKSLEIEDYAVQPLQDISPPKWHLAHTTWFFEELILIKFKSDFLRYDESYRLLFNSYYKSAGPHWAQSARGHLSRPTVKSIYEYRDYINKELLSLARNIDSNSEINFLLEVGINHEQQHQELLLMDIKYILSVNPSYPKYSDPNLPVSPISKQSWKKFNEAIYEIGNHSEGFAYDNEGPRHKTYVYPFEIRESVISNGEYLEFIENEGYLNSKIWLSEGWEWVKNNSIECPLYWRKINNEWFEFTLHGLIPLDLDAPLTHISYFEADAFANWTTFRLPTESELEIFFDSANKQVQTSNDLYHPFDVNEETGQVWCWTKSHYSPYPGFKTFQGMLGEYNGKFMCNQFVLRGGSVITSNDHYRNSYRNFYQPHQRWMLSGIRLVKDVD